MLAHQVAFVPQREEIIFDFSVYDMVMMGRNPYQSRWAGESAEDKRIVEEVLANCRLSPLRDRMLTQLSGGEMQRALIARAMAQQTPVLLLDEPLSNLDIIHKFEIMDILKKLNLSQKTTILIIMHDFPFAKQYTQKTILLKEGVKVHDGKTDEVLTPEIIRQIFDLHDDYIIDVYGNIRKEGHV
jgi:iron complex transport system ATP-binding protein